MEFVLGVIPVQSEAFFLLLYHKRRGFKQTKLPQTKLLEMKTNSHQIFICFFVMLMLLLLLLLLMLLFCSIFNGANEWLKHSIQTKSPQPHRIASHCYFISLFFIQQQYPQNCFTLFPIYLWMFNDVASIYSSKIEISDRRWHS